MNNLGIEQQNNKALYRELFLKASEDLKKQINKLKTNFTCKKDGICRKIRYTELSPADIHTLNQREESISGEYINLLLPYGADKNFDYETDNYIDLEENNKLARDAAPEYVDLIIKNSNMPVYFYYFKETNESICPKSHLFSNFPQSVTTILPKDCIYREWQKQTLKKFQEKVTRDIQEKLLELNAHSKNFHCKKTGTCCKMACSEFSYEELKEKAMNGDIFAIQFTSVFVPYKNPEDARKIFPEYYDLVHETLNSDEQVYFYYCPHLTKENLCSIYEDRPPVCRDFPNNPLAILPECCGFYEWKEDVHVAAMLLHALIALTEFYVEKISHALDD